MILNLPTLLLLFLAGLAAALGAGLALLALLLALFPGREPMAGEPPAGWRRQADGAVQAGLRVALVLAALCWPLLYLTLASYIPRIPGAMCIFGVTQATPTLVHTAEVAWPLALFGLGLALLLARIDRATPGAPTRLRNRAVLALVAGLLVYVAWITIRYLLAEKGGVAVSCCTTSRDLAPGPGFFQYLRLTLESGGASTHPYLAVAAGLLVALALAATLGPRLPARILPLAAPVLGLLAIGSGLALLQLLSTSISPVLLGLPFHRCLYCLLLEVPDAPLFMGAGLLAAMSAGWAAAVALLADPAGSAPAQRTVLALWRTAAQLQACSLIMVAVHLLGAWWR